MLCSLRSALTSAQQNNYATLAILIALVYDHVLTFPKEIEYIWSKRWTWVTLLYVLVRYVGLYGYMILNTMVGSTILNIANAKTYVSIQPSFYDAINDIDIFQTDPEGKTMFIIEGWSFLLFLGAADLVMTLRVWAIYNRWMPILVVLLAFFSMEIIATVLFDVLSDIPKDYSVVTTKILNSSSCAEHLNISPAWLQVSLILQIAHSSAMCILVVIRFTRRSLQTYRSAKLWRQGPYMSSLIKQGVLYFLAFLLSFLVDAVSFFDKCPKGGWQFALLLFLEYVPIISLPPRFILSIHELFERGPQAGMSTGHGAGIVFANFEEDEAADDMQMEDGTLRSE